MGRKKKFNNRFIKNWISQVRDSLRKGNYNDVTLEWQAKQVVTDKPYDPYIWCNIEAARKLLAERKHRGIVVPFVETYGYLKQT
jgi:hypothetical protein